MTDKTMTQLAEKVGECIGLLQHLCETRLRGEECARARLAYQELREAFTRHLSQPAESGEAVGYVHPIKWNSRQSEQVIKITRSAQPEYGFIDPLYTAPPPAAGVPDEQVASFVEKAAEIIGGKHFPSGQSLTKAREICDLAMAMLSATPSPTIDVAAVHGFHGFEIVENARVPEGEVWVYDKTKLRAIGEEK